MEPFEDDPGHTEARPQALEVGFLKVFQPICACTSCCQRGRGGGLGWRRKRPCQCRRGRCVRPRRGSCRHPRRGSANNWGPERRGCLEECSAEPKGRLAATGFASAPGQSIWFEAGYVARCARNITAHRGTNNAPANPGGAKEALPHQPPANKNMSKYSRCR